MRRAAIIAAGLAALAVLAGVGVVAAQGTGQGGQQNGDGPVQTDTVETIGRNGFIPNAIVFSTLAFHPGAIQVSQGQTVRFSYGDADLSNEPHTVTFISEQDLPTSVDDVFMCQQCGQALVQHFGGMEGPGAMSESEGQMPGAPAQAVVNAGEDGLDAPGDSLWMSPGDTIEADVTAASGTTLHYLCAIHPWMQGRITVGGG